MAYKDYLQKVKERNQRLIEHKRKHPRMTNAALGRVFKLSRERVRQILCEANNGR
jgi:DNA-directed RNA polymerase sigma subunit (sigma70/sigma32)